MINKINDVTNIKEYEMPRIFKNARSATNITEYNGYYVCIVRLKQGDINLHSFIKINRNTLEPKQYSLPFCFRKISNEKCMGLSIQNNVAQITMNEIDIQDICVPGLITVNMENIKFIDIK